MEMGADRRDQDTREVRLEGVGLIVTGGVLIALLAGAFYLGRWVERQSGPVSAATEAGDDGPLAAISDSTPQEVEVDSGSSTFDQAAPERAEPRRQAAASGSDTPAAAPATAKDEPAPAAPATAGGFYIQVFAGRDRASAETLVNELKRNGYGVKMVSERESGGALYKVRVGGYATRDDAVDASRGLQKAGYTTWIMPGG
jgi:cell division septation protein DedD